MKLAYAIFYTEDIGRIKAFYESSLGFKVAFGDDRFVAFKIGEALLGVKIKEIDREIPGHQTAIMEVDDVDAWYKKLKEGAIEIFSEIVDQSWGRNFSILDPDGNRIEFFTSQ